VFKIIKKLIEALQIVHEAGYVYNDIKLENVMIKQNKDETSSDLKVVLVDYGMAMKYTDEAGDHLENQEMDKFCGNLIFASLDVLNFNRPSRKDDLQMLCYFLIYLLNGGEMPLIWDFLGDHDNCTKQD
jgi:serine/threonine protein kinase